MWIPNELRYPHILKENQNVFVVAHGNSLRSIIMHLDGLTSAEVLDLELATGVPVIYQFRDNQLVKCSS